MRSDLKKRAEQLQVIQPRCRQRCRLAVAALCLEPLFFSERM